MNTFKNTIKQQTFSLMRVGRTLVYGLILFLFHAPLTAQTAYHNYISKYADLAVEQMYKHKIPASITLAQGLLESGAGQSRLAVKANNHFGIKKGSTWDGPTIKHDDDKRNEHFRKYRTPEESYEDHSLFLTSGKRYASLFQLDITDYKGWAKGLKRAGYATNPRYAEQLIDIIERYNLQRYDYGATNKVVALETNKLPPTVETQVPQSEVQSRGIVIQMCNENFYVIARTGDTFKSLSKILGISQRKLRKYNEVDKNYVLRPGSIVYLKKKQKKAHKSFKGYRHIIKPGESIYTIAQLYGMRVETLYRINKLSEDYIPNVGGALLIRK